MFQIRVASKALALAVFSGLVATGCSTNGSNTLPLQPSSVLQSLKADGASAKALYVADFWGKSVFRFVRNADGTLVTPAGSSLVLQYNPGPIAISHSGNLLVTDAQHQAIYVYRKGATANDPPVRTLLLPFLPTSVAIDKDGYVYSGGLTNGYVAVYAPGAHGLASTIQRISPPDKHFAINGVAVDASGDLYISDTNEVSEFSTPTVNPTLVRAIVGSGEQNAPSGMAIGATGELYVANAGDSNILAYSPTANGTDPPDRTISSKNPPLKGTAAVALAQSLLYATSGTSLNGPASVFVLNANKGSQNPKQVVTGAYLAFPDGVAIGP